MQMGFGVREAVCADETAKRRRADCVECRGRNSSGGGFQLRRGESNSAQEGGPWKWKYRVTIHVVPWVLLTSIAPYTKTQPLFWDQHHIVNNLNDHDHPVQSARTSRTIKKSETNYANRTFRFLLFLVILTRHFQNSNQSTYTQLHFRSSILLSHPEQFEAWGGLT